MMFSRLIPKASHLRLLTLISSNYRSHTQSSHNRILPSLLRPLSTNHNNNGTRDQRTSDPWKISQENDAKFDSFFNEDAGNLAGIADAESPADESRPEESSWLNAKSTDVDDIFKGIDKEMRDKSSGGGEDDWLSAEGYKPWSLVEEEKVDVFDLGEVRQGDSETVDERSDSVIREKTEEDKNLEREEKELTAILKGPNRAFGDLIAASGITDAMLDSLIALKDLEMVEGLPPLSVIEDMRYEKNTKRSTRAEIELQKQEEIAKARVRQVDDKGRAYGTGRRKCSIARVWIQPGEGKFVVNDKEFDVYFPMLDHRAALLRPFSETKTLGLWDVNCTVKGGGVTGQVGAIQLGISRALQNWEPDLRPPLRNSGFLTRDPRVVERKKPGKAKARKSFQWVKR